MASKIESRFKKSAKVASELAKDEAVLQKHSTVSSLHMLIGLFRQNGEAYEILHREGVTLLGLRRELNKYSVGFATKVKKDPTYAQRVVKTFFYALNEASNDAGEEDLKLEAIDVIHLLRGLLRDSGGTAAQALLKLDVVPSQLYSKLALQSTPQVAEA